VLTSNDLEARLSGTTAALGTTTRPRLPAPGISRSSGNASASPSGMAAQNVRSVIRLTTARPRRIAAPKSSTR